MEELAGPYLIVCAILALGGIAKMASPGPAHRAMHALHLRLPLPAVRLIGTGELALAVAGATFSGAVLPGIVGLSYLTFAAFVAAMLANDSAVSCGCFGTAATPPSRLHVAINLLCAGVAFFSLGTPGLSTVLANQPMAGVPLLALATLGTYLLLQALTLLPTVLGPPRAVATEFSVSHLPTPEPSAP